MTVCDTVNICSVLSVTIGGSGNTNTNTSTNQAVAFNPSTPTVAVGQTINVTVSGGASSFVVAAPLGVITSTTALFKLPAGELVANAVRIKAARRLNPRFLSPRE